MSELCDAAEACRVLREATELIREDPIREGSLLRFGGAGQLVMTGDMHGNLKNFDKLQRFCSIDKNPARSVVLHELIHQELTLPGQVDRSIELLLAAARWKIEYPDNVYFLQSNHELAQLRGQEITKGGRSVLFDFEYGVRSLFGTGTRDVLTAVSEYVAALPLAARTRNGVFMSHSLPDPLLLSSFDLSVFERAPTDFEMAPGGAAYSLVWGRFQTVAEIDLFAERLGVEHILVGHTPQELGHAHIGRMIILASDHAHGTFLPFDLSRSYTGDELESAIRKFVSVE